MISSMKYIGLNLAALLCKILYQLQGGVIVECCAQEGQAIQVLHEQKINMDQLNIQRDVLVAQANGLEQAIEDACRSILKLVVLAELPVAEWVHRLAARVCEAQEEKTNVQLILNLQIVKLRLKAQPSTPPEVREKHARTIQMGLGQIGQVTQGCTGMLEQALTIPTHLQEDPNLQFLETEA